MEKTYFRSGLGLKAEVRPLIDSEYQSAMVELIRSRGYTDTFGDVTVRLAQEFGFCYGVDRAVDYAYETRIKFPDKRIFLVGEIIHNPHVNHRLQEMGIEFIYPEKDGHFSFDQVTPEDVVIIPAFGVTLKDFNRLKEIGCVLVDTTCGSVLVVWKRVDSYAKDGFTAVIHGKYTHEESRATASQVNKHPGGRYLIVRDMEEAKLVCDYIAKRPGHLSREEFYAHFKDKATEGFDPDRALEKIGIANQTTMLANESLAIGAENPGSFRRGFRRGTCPRALPLLRHHLLCHPGAPGRRGRDDEGPAGHHDRHRRIQLIKHQPPRPYVQGPHPDLPHRGRGVHRRGRRDDPA